MTNYKPRNFQELDIEAQARKEALSEMPIQAKQMFKEQIELSTDILKNADKYSKSVVEHHQANLKDINERLDIVVACYKSKLNTQGIVQQVKWY